MSLADCEILPPPWKWFDYPTKPPVIPAERRMLLIHKNIGRRHRKRKTRLETQGKANKRVWKEYMKKNEPGSLFGGFSSVDSEIMATQFKMGFEMAATAVRGRSLYDYLMSK